MSCKFPSSYHRVAKCQICGCLFAQVWGWSSRGSCDIRSLQTNYHNELFEQTQTFSRPVIQGTFLEDRACVVTANAAFYNNSTKQEYFVI